MSVMEYDIHKSTRHCSKTGRELKPGEAFYSVLKTAGGTLIREDFSLEAWEAPPGDALGWWKSLVASPDAKRIHWAPNDVMLHLFDELAERPDQADLRYVLALLLVRRRVMRLEDTEKGEGSESMILYCPRRASEYRVATAPPSEVRIAEIQQELARLLFAHAT